MKRAAILAVIALTFVAERGGAAEVIRLANNPALSPNGATLAFDWDGDVWTVPTAGGVARRLTNHPARDREPRFSPDGAQPRCCNSSRRIAQVSPSRCRFRLSR